MFNLAADLLANATAFAHTLGLRVALGTETPLTLPPGVHDVQSAFEGTFERIERKLRAGTGGGIDAYWHWAHEAWATEPYRSLLCQRETLSPRDPG